MKKRIISILISLLMVIEMIPLLNFVSFSSSSYGYYEYGENVIYHGNIKPCPYLDEDDAAMFIGFITNNGRLSESEIKNNEYYQIITGTYNGPDEEDLVFALKLFIEMNTSKMANKANENKTFFENEIVSYLEKHVPSDSSIGLTEEIIGGYQNKCSGILVDAFKDIIDYFFSDANSVFQVSDVVDLYMGVTGSINKAKKIVDYSMAAIDGICLIYENEFAGRYSYFQQYLTHRSWGEPGSPEFETMLYYARMGCADSNWLARMFDIFTFITHKDSFLNHFDVLERWAEYTYQLGEWCSQDLTPPEKPELIITNMTNRDHTIFEWNPTADTRSYKLQIFTDNNDCVCDKSLTKNDIFFDMVLPVGSYCARLSSLNNSFTTLGDIIYFEVSQWTEVYVDSIVHNGHVYKYFDINLTWSEAEKYCRSLGGHLATITSQDEQDAIAGLVRNGTRMAYWLDGTDSGHEGTWRWVNGEPFNYFHWSPIQPDNAGGIEHHLAMFRDNGDWNDEYENLLSRIMVMGFVCEFEFSNMKVHKQGAFGNNRYFVFETSLSWQDAEAYCENFNGHLVTITSKEEQRFVESLVSGGSRIAYWMGATDDGHEGEWSWVTGEPFTYSNWSGCQPDNEGGYENYLTMYNQRYFGKWNDISKAFTTDTYTLGFICEQDFSKIEYDANGGTNAPELLWKSFDTTVNISRSIPTRNGYTFLGWSTNKYLKNVDYNPGDEYSANEDLKLYAVWRNDGPVKQITFDSILPALLIPPAISTSESEIIIPGYTPTYEGWAFIGWNETGNPSDSVPIYRPGDRISVEDDISLYAIWCASDLGGSLGKEGYYAVYYFPNGGDWDEGNDVIKRSEYQLGLLKKGDDYVFPESTDTLHRDGYKLHTKDSDFSTPIFFTGNGAGWNLYGLNINNGYEYPIYPNGESKFTITSDDFAYGTNIILYAAWDPIVKYDMGEGIVVQDFVDVTKESKYKILAAGDTTKYSSNTSETSVDGYDGASEIPVRERFVLTYWTDSSGNKYYPGQEYKITKPTTLYANWRALVEVCSHPNFTEEIIEEASCETNGVTRYICTACGYTYEDNIAPVATGHNFDDGVVTTSPTCTENGEKTYTCSKCGETKTEEILSAGHNYVLSETVEPTCTECGHSDYICEICADVISFDIPANGHEFGEWQDHPDDSAKEIRYCIHCDASEIRDKVATQLKGDVDNDGEVNDLDAILLNRYLAGWENIEVDMIAADIDGDGEVNDWDAIILERYLAGWIIPE